MIFAINKIDKQGANPEKIKEKLAAMNLLVEDWGGKYQSHDISAKKGTGVKELLEKVLLEAEILDLKANPNKLAVGTVVEAQLDKGRGYVSTILVQSGTLKVGDYVLAGKNHGKVKAMHDERGHIVTSAGPSTPISILGLDGASTAGDKFNVFEDEREAKQIATKRLQLMREQSVRTQRHITLAEIGRRIALGQFKELNIILKGDVDGSVEALSSEFSKLSTDEIQINIIHKGVGAITETDVMLASASDAIIIGFNVRPAGNARQIAQKEEIDIRSYSIIYDAINDLKDAMEGMLSPEMKEEITGTAEIREIFKVSKVGTIAGCMVTDGKIFRNSKIRIIREGVVVFTGELATLKRFKDDVKDVAKGYDCGIQIKNYNDIEQLDIIEAFQEVEVKKKMK
jgi:translation initiation factor IF-2